MKNPFRPKEPKVDFSPNDASLPSDAAPDASTPGASTPGAIRAPWERTPGEDLPPLRETVVGQRAQTATPPPPPDSDRSYQCPECSYPLEFEASEAVSCPNCGSTGEQSAVPSPTVRLDSLSPEPSVPSRAFSLVSEATSEVVVSQELPDTQAVILGRKELAPDNDSLQEEHIQLRADQQGWYVGDGGTLGATLIQAVEPQRLLEGSVVVLGNRRFRFSTGPTADVALLTDEASGTAHRFDQSPVVLNRASIDSNERTISSQQHARLERQQGHWLITDQSSNGATFAQVRTEAPLPDQARLLLGNSVFRFRVE